MKSAMRGLVLGMCLLATALGLHAQNAAVTVNVDLQANRHPISPLIYGVNLFEDPNLTSTLQDLNCPLNRYGGNRASTYNWNLNSDNRGNDNYFESISDNVQTAGERGDTFITATQSAGAEPMVTIPMLSWIGQAGLAQPFLCSYPKTKFPNQFAFDPSNTNCGDGLMLDGKTLINGADPTVALVANTLATQQSWVQHITGKFNTAANGGLKYYVLDNEHDLWWETHHDAVANAPSYTQDRDGMFSYAGMIKSQDANALVVGPEVSGWLGYILSPADFEYGQLNGFANINNFPDRTAMNGMDYMPWLLGQFQAYANSHNGQRLLDVFTVHYYPQGGDNKINTRSLWDPNFVDPSYINDKIMLIPRMKAWVAANYPGTKIGITEYNWGYINEEALHDNIGYAVNQADVLGIFGREGLDLATRFNSPPVNLPTYNSMKMYRNYDGNKSTFGDVSTSATVPNPDTVAAFSAQRSSDGKLTVMLLSKYAAGDTPATVSFAKLAYSGPAQVWQLISPGTAIQHLADVNVNNSAVSLTLPPQSITLLVIPTSTPLNLTPPSVSLGNAVVGRRSASSSITINNANNFSITLNNVGASGDFSQTSNCGNGLAANASCTVLVSFAPTATGPRNGTLTVNSTAASSPQSVNLSGTGVDFAITLARPARSPRTAAARIIAAGGTSSFQLKLTATPSFDGLVELRCAAASRRVSCRTEPNVVHLSGAAKNVSVTLGASLPAAHSKRLQLASPRNRGRIAPASAAIYRVRLEASFQGVVRAQELAVAIR